jgi:HSP20 family molecular chaperone IbpA
MVTIKIQENIDEVVERKIRRYFDEQKGIWYFSIVDIIGILTNSTDARNYWKVLKNRLKKSQNELVTKCNQLKMKSKDGKYYLTDTADKETILKIIESVPRVNIPAFKRLVEDIERGKKEQSENITKSEISDNESHIAEKEDDVELLIDGYQTETSIYIEAMLAGVEPEDIHITASDTEIKISGKRQRPKEDNNDYFLEELLWDNFSRIVSLPSPIQKDNIETSEENGHLIIKLLKI